MTKELSDETKKNIATMRSLVYSKLDEIEEKTRELKMLLYSHSHYPLPNKRKPGTYEKKFDSDHVRDLFNWIKRFKRKFDQWEYEY